MPRIDFSPATIRLVAQRAAYMCSFPGCGRLTVGPGTELHEVSNTGVAAHIYPASPKGPRGIELQESQEIDSPSNAIWLCNDHARLIDNNKGSAFPHALLTAYKSLHETRISCQQSGINVPRGWFHKIELHSAPLFKTPASLELGKVTVITGANDIGKTALWQWLAAVGDQSTLMRWLRRSGSDPHLDVDITYFDPVPRTVGFAITEAGTINYRVDGTAVPMQPYSLRFVIPKHPRDIRGWERIRDDIRRLAVILQTDSLVIKDLSSSLIFAGKDISRLELIARKQMTDVYAAFRNQTPFLRIGQWSSGELSRVIVVFAAALARFYATYNPTVLVLDSIATTMDNSGLISTVQFLSRLDFAFQTVIAIPSRTIDYDLLATAGARVVWLSGSKPHVQIDSVPYA